MAIRSYDDMVRMSTKTKAEQFKATVLAAPNVRAMCKDIIHMAERKDIVDACQDIRLALRVMEELARELSGHDCDGFKAGSIDECCEECCGGRDGCRAAVVNKESI